MSNNINEEPNENNVETIQEAATIEEDDTHIFNTIENENKPQEFPSNQNIENNQRSLNTLTISPPNQDIIDIQNDLLSQITNLESRLSKKVGEIESSTSEALLVYSQKLTDLSHKIDSLISNNANYNNKISKIDDFDAFKRKADDQLITHEIRINNTMKDLANAKFKYDKLFSSNLTVPGYVGECSQFKTLAEYIDYNINLVSSLVSSRDKIQNDLKQTKQATESMIKDYVKVIDSKEKRCNEYTDKKIKEVLFKFDDNKKEINEKFMQVRVENTKALMDFKAKMNDFMNEWSKITTMRDEIFAKLSDHLFIYKTDFNTSQTQVKEMMKEFKKIKMRFGEMVEFIKDVRFRKNIGTIEVKKKEIDTLIKKVKPNKKKSLSIEFNKSNDVDLNYNFQTGERIESEPEAPKKRESLKHLLQKINYQEDEQPITTTQQEQQPRKQISPLQKDTQQQMSNHDTQTQYKGIDISDEDDLGKRTTYGQFKKQVNIKANQNYQPLKTHPNFSHNKPLQTPKVVELDLEGFPNQYDNSNNIFSFPSTQHYIPQNQDYRIQYQLKTINASRNNIPMNYDSSTLGIVAPRGGTGSKKFRALNTSNTAHNKITSCFGSTVNTTSSGRRDFINCANGFNKPQLKLILINKKKV